MGELEVKRFFIFVVILCCIAFLAGCHSDEKQAAQIQEKMDDSASYEEAFVSNQEHLKTYREKGQSVYNDLLELDIQDTDTIQSKIDDGKTYLKKQEALLKEAEKDFQRAYKESSAIKENVEKIKGERQKNQASDLLDIMVKRKKVMDAFFNDYQGQLKLLNSFYDYLEDDELKGDEMDEQIDQMNENNEEIEEIIEEFNNNTKEYNETEARYYEIVDAD